MVTDNENTNPWRLLEGRALHWFLKGAEDSDIFRECLTGRFPLNGGLESDATFVVYL